MSVFTPISGTIGGALIGGSAGLLLLLNGDIMGLSGIMSNSLGNVKESLLQKDSKHHWRWVFVGSFGITVNALVHIMSPSAAFGGNPSLDSDVPIPSFLGHVLGGLLVGMGTRIGNGCTTGHGICGLGRFSPRSLVSVVTFTGTSILTRFLVSPLRSWSMSTALLRKDTPSLSSPVAAAAVMFILALPTLLHRGGDIQKRLGAALSGSMFAAGLGISGMTQTSKVHGFLCFSLIWAGQFDPTLICVLGSGILASVASYQLISGYGKCGTLQKPLNQPKGSTFSAIPTNQTIDNRLIMGSFLFGVGWGLTGICPGPGLYAAAAGVWDAIIGWVPSFLIGSHFGKHLVSNIWEKRSNVTKKL
mmetsp:Transcript_16234/g.24530  ORF Transcript_16234/g.24530 Transcript_16234/m.24530 type:complete len:360 (-) Transcript_16234:221-1300(-)